MMSSSCSQRGVVEIYITLILVLLITSATVILGGLIARQIRLSQSIVTTEQAFYAADGALEEALYSNIKNGTDPADVTGTVTYDDGSTASYDTHVYRDTGGIVCGESTGMAGTVNRRVTHGNDSCVFD